MFTKAQQFKVDLESLGQREAGGLVLKTGGKFSELEFAKLKKIDTKAAAKLMAISGTLHFPLLEEISLELANIFTQRTKPGLIFLRRNIRFESEESRNLILKAIHLCKIVLFL